MRPENLMRDGRSPFFGAILAFALVQDPAMAQGGTGSGGFSGGQGPASGNGSGWNGGSAGLGGGGAIEACTGYFLDPGGAGNYANGEDLVVTICPVGGAGSGPSTAVLFLEWQLAATPGDVLEIFDADTDAGAPIATGDHSNTLAGQSFTSTHASGCLTFRWHADASDNAAGWRARITTAPNPGDDSAADICSSAPPVPLFSLLQGDPDIGGSWKDPLGAPNNGTLEPANDVGGN